jgi:dinuclear metal center YbgI/SA1388 family protein
MIMLNELLTYCNTLLASETFDDYCPNGLQVEGRSVISRIVSGVTATQALIDAAIAAEADLLLVHHGLFWRGDRQEITGMRYQRLRRLLGANIGLLAYHLPLDAHAELGNNRQLAEVCGLPEIEGNFGKLGLGCWGSLDTAVTANELAAAIGGKLQREVSVIRGGEHTISSVGWCSGAAQSYLEAAADCGLDAFISGEVNEATTHIARERGIHYLNIGHHASERYGVQALGEHLASRFAVQHQFIDIDNPV